MTLSVHIVPDFTKRCEIESEWNEAVNKHHKNPFLLTGFVKEWMEFWRSKGWTPLPLVISVHDAVVGIAPLMTRKKSGIRSVKFLLKDWFSPDFVFDDQQRENCVASLIHFLFETLQCHSMDLTLPAESPNLPILRTESKRRRMYFWMERGMGHCIIPIRQTWKEYERWRGRKFRKKFRRARAKLDQAGSWRTICIGKETKESNAFEKILSVERKSWKQAYRARDGTIEDRDLLMIWKGAQETAQNGSDFTWRVWFLELNDQTLAYTLVVEYKETAYIAKTSFHEAYREFQPGAYINNVAVHQIFEEGQITNIDWLTDLRFHRNWTKTCLSRIRVMVSPSSAIRITKGFVLPNLPNYLRDILGRFLK